MQELSTLVARVDRLERANRRWKRAGALASIGLFGLLASSLAAPDEVVRGTSLELSTQEGTPYARIFLDAEGEPMLLLKKGDEKGHALLTLNEPALHVRGKDGLRGAFVGFDTRGLSKVELTGAALDGVRMSMKPDGTAGVYALDSEGFDRATLEVTSDGHAQVDVREPKGRVRSALAVDAAGNSSVVLLDPAGRRRVGSVVLRDGTPVFALEDEHARQRVNLSMEFDGAPKLEFLTPDGQVFERLP